MKSALLSVAAVLLAGTLCVRSEVVYEETFEGGQSGDSVSILSPAWTVMQGGGGWDGDIVITDTHAVAGSGALAIEGSATGAGIVGRAYVNVPSPTTDTDFYTMRARVRPTATGTHNSGIFLCDGAGTVMSGVQWNIGGGWMMDARGVCGSSGLAIDVSTAGANETVVLTVFVDLTNSETWFTVEHSSGTVTGPKLAMGGGAAPTVIAGVLVFEDLRQYVDGIDIDDIVVTRIPGGGLIDIPGADGAGVTEDFHIAARETTTDDYVAFLNSQTSGEILVDTGQVTWSQTGELLCLTQAADPRAQLAYDELALPGEQFSVAAGFENHPVVFVSWFGAAVYCNWLSGLEGLTAVYDPGAGWETVGGAAGYRLPSEAQWYKAAAWDAGSNVFRVYGSGMDVMAGAVANFLNSGDAWEENQPATSPVLGVYHCAAPYGLMDCSGNAWEWCHGFYDDAAADVDVDPHAARGGSWGNLRTDVKAASRCGFKPAMALNSVGFRVMRPGSAP